MGLGLTLDDGARDSFEEQEDQASLLVRVYAAAALTSVTEACTSNGSAPCRFVSLCRRGPCELEPVERYTSSPPK